LQHGTNTLSAVTVCAGEEEEEAEKKKKERKKERKKDRKEGRLGGRTGVMKMGKKKRTRERKNTTNQALNAQKFPKNLAQDIWVSSLLYTASRKRTSMHECKLLWTV